VTIKALTVEGIKAMKRAKIGEQYDIFDQGYPGLHIRVGRRNKTFCTYYRLDKKLCRVKLGIFPAMTLAQAREAWRKVREDVAAGLQPVTKPIRTPAPAPVLTFKRVFEDWMARDQADNRSARAVRKNMENEFLPLWADRAFKEIARSEIRDAIDKIADRGVVAMARRSHARLRRLFTWAVSRDIIAVNPMTGLEAPGSETERDRVLTDPELVAVWNAAGELGYPMGPAIQLLILTGARREEIGKLRWSEIDDGVIKLKGERTKNGEPHDIPLSSSARSLLANLPRFAESDFVFTYDGRRPVHSWPLAKQKIDAVVRIEAWRLHDLRRTTATNLQKLGVSLQVTESVLGHVSGSRAGVIGIYQRHQYAAEKSSALEAWAAYVDALAAGKTPGDVVPFTRQSPAAIAS
jgi:integrase